MRQCLIRGASVRARVRSGYGGVDGPLGAGQELLQGEKVLAHLVLERAKFLGWVLDLG
jgi:hypothetical protein